MGTYFVDQKHLTEFVDDMLEDYAIKEDLCEDEDYLWADKLIIQRCYDVPSHTVAKVFSRFKIIIVETESKSLAKKWYDFGFAYQTPIVKEFNVKILKQPAMKAGAQCTIFF